MRNLHLNCYIKTELSNEDENFKLNPNNFHFHAAPSGDLTVYSSGKVLRRVNDEFCIISVSETLQAENITDDNLAGLEVTSEETIVLATQKGNSRLVFFATNITFLKV